MSPAIEKHASRESWLAARSTFIGASEIGGAMLLRESVRFGITPWRIFHEKVGLPIEPKPVTDRMRWGNVMERVALWWLQETWDVNTGFLDPWTLYRHDRVPWLACTPDDVLTITEREAEKLDIPAGRWTVDCKIASPWSSSYRDGKAPGNYEAQIAHQMLATDADHGVLVVLPFGERVNLEDEARFERITKHVAALVEDHNGLDVMDVLALLGVDEPFIRVYHRESARTAGVIGALVHDGNILWHKILAARATLAKHGGELSHACWADLRQFEPDMQPEDRSDFARRAWDLFDEEAFECVTSDQEEFVGAFNARRDAEERYESVVAKLSQAMGQRTVLSCAGKKLATFNGNAKGGRTFRPSKWITAKDDQ